MLKRTVNWIICFSKAYHVDGVRFTAIQIQTLKSCFVKTLIDSNSLNGDFDSEMIWYMKILIPSLGIFTSEKDSVNVRKYQITMHTSEVWILVWSLSILMFSMAYKLYSPALNFLQRFGGLKFYCLMYVSWWGIGTWRQVNIFGCFPFEWPSFWCLIYMIYDSNCRFFLTCICVNGIYFEILPPVSLIMS